MIADNEGLHLDDDTLGKLIESTGGGDLRQIINLLQMWKSQEAMTSNDDGNFFKKIAKDEMVMINNFEAALRLLNCGEKPLDDKYPSFRQKLDLFFVDYEFVPLLVQESYLNAFQDRR